MFIYCLKYINNVLYVAFPDSSVGKKKIHRLQCKRSQSDSWIRTINWRRDRQPTPVFLGFPCGSVVKNLPAMRETWVGSLGWEDPLEKGKATLSGILAWRIPWTVPMGLQRLGHD